MKKLILPFLLSLSFIVCLQFPANAVISSKQQATLSQLMPELPGYDLPVGLTIGEFLDLRPKDFKRITGKKLGLKNKIALRFIKWEVKKSIRKGERPDPKKAACNFNFGGFALGFFLGLIGFLIALAFKDKCVRKSALKGWLAAIIFILLLSIL